jgi:hypothetical protein
MFSCTLLALLAPLAAAQDPVFRTLHEELDLAGSSLASGDFDEDGLPDLAVDIGGKLRLFFGRGDGSFVLEPPVIVAGMAPRHVVAADISGDGHLDLMSSDSFNHNVNVALGAGDGTFGAPAIYTVDNNPAALLVAHLNGDGLPDLAVANDIGPRISVLLGAGGGAFAQYVSYGPTGERPRSVAAADFDGDGDLDLAFGNFPEEFVSIFPNNGDGTLGNQAEPLTPPPVCLPLLSSRCPSTTVQRKGCHSVPCFGDTNRSTSE